MHKLIENTPRIIAFEYECPCGQEFSDSFDDVEAAEQLDKTIIKPCPNCGRPVTVEYDSDPYRD